MSSGYDKNGKASEQTPLMVPPPPPIKSPGGTPFYFLKSPDRPSNGLANRDYSAVQSESDTSGLNGSTGASSIQYNSSITSESGISDGIPSRPVFQNLPQIISEGSETSKEKSEAHGGVQFLNQLFGKAKKPAKNNINIVRHGDPSGSGSSAYQSTEIPMRLLMSRKVKLSIEPKVPLANERTLLAWFHWATLLAGAALALTSFAQVEGHPARHLYGLMLIPLAIAVIVYALQQYGHRSYLINSGVSGGVFYDIKGPVILGSVMIVSLVLSFIIKVAEYSIY